MAEYRVAIVLDAQGRAFVGEINQATGSLVNLRAATDQGATSVSRMAQQTAAMESQSRGLVSTLRGAAGLITAVLGAAVAREVLQTGLAFDALRTKIAGITQDSAQTKAELGFLREVTERLGFSFRKTAEDYGSLLAAARGTPLAAYTEEIAESVLTAGRAYQLSGEQIRGALTAIEQMISKVTVSAEELRGQLGERLPGAFQIAARAMGVTTQELGEMLQKGEVVAEDFLPKFARELRNATQAGADLAASKPAAEFERLRNAIEDSIDQAAAAVLPALAEGAKSLAEQLREMNESGALTEIGEGLAFVARNADVLIATIGLLVGGRALGALGGALRTFLTNAALTRVSLAAMATGAAGGVGAMQTLSGAVGLAGRSLVGLAGGPLALAAVGIATFATQTTNAEERWRRFIDTTANADTALANVRDTVIALGVGSDVGVAQLEAQLRQVRGAALDLDPVLLAIQQEMDETTNPARWLQLQGRLEATKGKYNSLVEAAVRLKQEMLAIANAAQVRSDNDAEATEYLDKLQKRTQAERDRILALKEGEAALIRIRAAEKASGVASEELAEQILAQAEELANLVEQHKSLQTENRVTAKEMNAAQTAAEDMIAALVEQRETLGLTEDELILYRAELVASALDNEELAKAVRDEAKATAEAVKAHEEAKRILDQLTASTDERTDALYRAEEASRILVDMEADLAAQLAGPSEESALEYERALARLVLLEDALAEGSELTAEQQQRLARIRSQLAEQQARDQKVIADAANEAAQEYQRAWERASESSLDAFSNFLADGLKDFDSFKDSLKDIAKQLMADLIKAFARRIILNMQVNAQGQGQGQVQGQTGSGGLGGLFGGQSGGTILGGDAGFGNYAGAAIGAYSVYDTFQNGPGGASGAISGGIAGASAGAQFGGYGAIIGAIIGVLAGFFGGRKEPDVRLGGGSTTIRNQEGSFETAFGHVRAGSRQISYESLIGPIQEFDEAIFSMVEGLSGGTAQLDAIRNALSVWRVDLRGSAATAENILNSRFAAILATFNSDIQQFVNGAGDLQDRFEALAQVLVLDELVSAGDALLPTLSEVLAVIEATKAPGESLTQTYERIAAATAVFDDALALSGVQMDLTRAEVIAFAAGVAEAAGGIQQAAQLWGVYFDTFYSEQERALRRLTDTTTTRDTRLADLGLDPTISLEEFRRRFEEALPTLSEEEIAQWLFASAAIRAVNDAQAAYNDTLGETVEQVEEATTATQRAREAAAALAESARALADYKQFIAGFADELRAAAQTDFANEIDEIRRWTDAQLEQAQAMATAAGMEAAAVEDLTLILEVSAQRTAAAMARARSSIQDLSSQLYGTALSNIEAQIAAYELAGQQVGTYLDQQFGGIDQIAQANEDRYQRELQLIQRLRDFAESLLLDGTLSPLSPQDRLSEAERQYLELLQRAQGGDLEALAQLEGAAQAYLSEARSFWGSTDAYSAIFEGVLAALQGLNVTGSPVVGGGGPGGGSLGPGGDLGGGGGVSGDLAALYAQRDALLAEQEAAQRRQLVDQLIRYLVDLAQASGQSVIELAAELGVPLNRLVADLGINLDELTAGTTQTLAGLAAQLGVEVVDLARAIGVELGDLANRQSLLNDALEGVILGLPESSSAALEPLFRALEDATSPEEQERALRALIDEANAQPEDIRRLLAPYLEGVDIEEQADAQVERLGFIDSSIGTTNTILERIEADEIIRASTTHGLLRDMILALGGTPSYAVGTSFVPRDGLAMLHAGEAVLTRSQADVYRGGLAFASSTQPNYDPVVSAIERLRQQSLSQGQEQHRELGRVVDRLDAVETRLHAIDSRVASAVFAMETGARRNGS